MCIYSYILIVSFTCEPYETSIHVLQGQLNSLKVVGAQLSNKTHFYWEKLNSYEHLQILWGLAPSAPWFRRL